MVWKLCILVLLFSACQQKPRERHYTEIAIEAPQESAPGASAAMGIPANPHAGLDMSAMGVASDMNSPMSNMFTWAAPPGWEQEAGGGMRLVTFHLAGNPKAIDCSIVSLGGMAGGLEANLRRWMGQIGIQASPEEISDLISSAASTKIKSGQGGKVFDFTAIESPARLTDKSMIVVMVLMDEATLFVKMAGTVDTVKKNKDDFFKLVDSIEFHSPSFDPHAGLDMSAMAGLINASATQSMLAWKCPEGWKEEAGSHMRMASFYLASDPKAIDCSIIALRGPAGGLEANLARWCNQIGVQASEDNLKQLTDLAQSLKTKDGFEVNVFDFTDLQPRGNPSDSSMLAAIMPLDSATVFIKMTGTMASVQQNKNNFLKLIGSIVRK